MTRHSSKLIRSFFSSGIDAYNGVWQPAADIYRAQHEWLVKLDLAGVRSEDIELSAQGNTLEVRGARRDLLMEEGHQFYSMEISYNSFQKRLEFPFNVETAQIHTEFCDGMLHIYIKTESES